MDENRPNGLRRQSRPCHRRCDNRRCDNRRGEDRRVADRRGGDHRQNQGRPAAGRAADAAADGKHGPCCTRTYHGQRHHQGPPPRGGRGGRVSVEMTQMIRMTAMITMIKPMMLLSSVSAGCVVGYGRSIQGHTIDATQLIRNRGHGSAHAGIVIAADPVGFHLIVQDRAQGADGQGRFRPVPRVM